MTIHEWISKSTKKLNSSSVPSARLDAEVLLADALKTDRSYVLAHPEIVLQGRTLTKLNNQIERRMKHEPIAYIRGKQEFYGRDFVVSPDTLTPRPETETLVDLALEIIKTKNIKTVADIGSGSGCIIISLVLDSNKKFSANGYELSESAIKIAKGNAKNLNARVNFRRTDITKTSESWCEADMIVANLPYVPDDFQINLAASHEPKYAIFGGVDGLDYYRLLFTQLSRNSKTESFVITEALPPQHSDLENIAKNSGFELLKSQDFIQVFKRNKTN